MKSFYVKSNNLKKGGIRFETDRGSNINRDLETGRS